MSTEDGTPYIRSAAVEEQIAETLCWSDADLPAKRKSLLNEVLGVMNAPVRDPQPDAKTCPTRMRRVTSPYWDVMPRSTGLPDVIDERTD